MAEKPKDTTQLNIRVSTDTALKLKLLATGVDTSLNTICDAALVDHLNQPEIRDRLIAFAQRMIDFTAQPQNPEQT